MTNGADTVAARYACNSLMTGYEISDAGAVALQPAVLALISVRVPTVRW